MHIAIAGNIGAGKTTLAERLASHFDWDTCFESVDDNPYLKDFYEDMPRWAFHLQIYFLNSRFEQVMKVQQNKYPTIQDRTIYEDAYVFARNLVESGLMSQRDYQNYFRVFSSMINYISPPHLLIYLRAGVPKLQSRITQRGRNFEANIPAEYLTDLNTHYEDWIENYTIGNLLIVDINEKDLLENPHEWADLIEKISDTCYQK